MKCILIMVLCFCSGQLYAQNYVDYQRIISRSTADILDSNYQLAMMRMDTLDQQYDFIYVSHCIKGLQLAILKGDEVRANRWLKRCMLQGAPVWALRSNTLTARALLWPGLQPTLNAYDSLHAVYLSRIDTGLAQRIQRMMDRDTRYTRRVNNGFVLLRKTLYGLQWIRNNTRSVKELEQIIAEHGYPEEKLIGLATAAYDSVELSPFIKRAGIALALQNRQAFFMYLHYYSSRRSGINPILWPQVIKGNMPVYQYARIHDYLAGQKKFRRAKIAYHEFDQPATGEDTSGLEARRASIGLPPFSVGLEVRSVIIKREFGGRANSEVIID